MLRRQNFALSADVWRPLQQVVKNSVQTSVFDANFDVLLSKPSRTSRYCTKLVWSGVGLPVKGSSGDALWGLPSYQTVSGGR